MPGVRPLLSVRLIGPAEHVNEHKAYLIAYLGDAFTGTICRTSTHPASHAGEIRAYLTVRRKEKG